MPSHTAAALFVPEPITGSPDQQVINKTSPLIHGRLGQVTLIGLIVLIRRKIDSNQQS